MSAPKMTIIAPIALNARASSNDKSNTRVPNVKFTKHIMINVKALSFEL